MLTSEGRLELDPAAISIQLDQLPAADSETPIAVLAGGKEVHFFGETFRFPKGLRQRDIICVLYDRYLNGEHWVSSAKIVDQLGLDPKTRIRDIFKRNGAWNRLLTERGGMCGFCFPDPK